MKNNGFTISELLVALAIIGVVAAAVAPSLTKMLPDKNKMKVLNAHSKIANAVNKLLDDDSLYNCEVESDDELEALACQSSIPGGTNVSGDTKFETLIVEKLGFKDSSGDSSLPWKASDGSFWGFNKVGSDNEAYYIITIDLNGKNKPNEVFSSTQTNPDRFRFKVNNYGGVTPNDALTEAYLRNSLASNAKGGDRDVAKKILTKKTYK